MKNRILFIALSICALVQLGCNKRMSEEGVTRSTNRFSELYASSSLSSMSFCSLTYREPELHFGLERNANDNVYVFTQDQVSAGMANFHSFFKYYDGTVVQELDSSKQSLSVNNLIGLYNLLQYDSTIDYDPDSNYSALRMHFGMDGKKVVLIYEPVVLKPFGTTKECMVVSTERYFRTDPANNLITVTSSDFGVLIGNFRGASSKLSIIHPNNPGVFNFIGSSDSTGDIRSNIISFQQVVRMYCDNVSSESSGDRINFTIVANQNASLTSNYRMHVVPNYNLGVGTALYGSYKSYAADYTQMCPTTCSIVSVNYYE